MNDGLELLRGDLGTLYFKDSFFRPVKEKKEIVYGKNNLQIGRRMDGSVFTLDLSEACRITGVGANRSGKTFFLGSIADRLVNVGNSLIFISDVKNEFCLRSKPVQKKFQHLLLEGETPKGMKIASLRPTFFRTIDKEKPLHSFWYSIDFRSLSKSEFMTLLNSEELTQNQRVALEIVYQRLTEELKKNPNLSFSVDLMNTIIDSIDELSSMQKNSLKFKFMPLEQAKFFVDRYERSIVDLMVDDFVPAINFENFDRFSKGGYNFPEVVMSIILREVIQARRDKIIKPLWIMMDEASRFIGERRNNSLKDVVLECLDENTDVQTNIGSVKIKDLDGLKHKVLSYNFDEKKKEFVDFKKFGGDEKEVYEVELENGKKIICSENHRLFTMGRRATIVERKVKDLKVGNRIVHLQKDELLGENMKSIKKIGFRKTYDLEVPSNSNFFLSNGVLSHNSVDLDSRYGVNWFFLSQNLDDVPTNILRQSKYILVPATADTTTIRLSLLSTGLVKNQQIAQNESMRLKRMMIKVPYSWIVLNRMSGSIDFIRPLAPLSHHMETSK